MISGRNQSPPPDHWTPDLVEARLVDAVRWMRFSGGGVGPASIRSAMPIFIPSLRDFAEEGWGLPERADEDEDLETRERPPTLEEIAALEDALTWVGGIIAPRDIDMARAVNAAVFAKAYDIPFTAVIRRRRMDRRTAYRLRDRGLSVISVVLDQRGVPAWQEKD